jgi:hypothetical protein
MSSLLLSVRPLAARALALAAIHAAMAGNGFKILGTKGCEWCEPSAKAAPGGLALVAGRDCEQKRGPTIVRDYARHQGQQSINELFGNECSDRIIKADSILTNLSLRNNSIIQV